MSRSAASSRVCESAGSSSSRRSRSFHRSSKARRLVTSSRRSKAGGRPASSGCSVRIRRAKPWSVEIAARSTSVRARSARSRRFPSASVRTTCSRDSRNRSRSSDAARSVKVMATIDSIGMARSRTIATMRPMRAVVLPVPAPASTKRFWSRSVAMSSRADWSVGGPVRLIGTALSRHRPAR